MPQAKTLTALLSPYILIRASTVYFGPSMLVSKDLSVCTDTNTDVTNVVILLKPC